MAPSLVIPDDDTVDQEGAAAPGLDTADQLMDQVTDQSPYDRALQLQQTAKTAYEKQKYTECVEICKEALKLSCNSELLTLVACSQVHCSMLDSAELHVNMSLSLDPMNGLALDLRAMLQEFIHKDYNGALDDLRKLKEHTVYKKPGLDEIIARVEAAMNRCADERKEAALKQARHSQADLPDASQQRIAIRERAKSVAKMYIDRAAQLQLDWERARDSGAAHSGTALAKTGVREEGLFSVAAALELLSLAQQHISEQMKLREMKSTPEANGQQS